MRSCQSCCAALAQMFRCAIEKQVPKQSKRPLSPWRIELPSLQLERMGPGRFQMNVANADASAGAVDADAAPLADSSRG